VASSTRHHDEGTLPPIHQLALCVYHATGSEHLSRASAIMVATSSTDDPDLDPVQLSTSKSLVRARGAARGVCPGDALAMLRLSGQEERAMLIHVEVTWTRGLRGEVSAVSGIDRARQSHTKLGVYVCVMHD
jgi:hypothetical protein